MKKQIINKIKDFTRQKKISQDEDQISKYKLFLEKCFRSNSAETSANLSNLYTPKFQTRIDKIQRYHLIKRVHQKKTKVEKEKT